MHSLPHVSYELETIAPLFQIHTVTVVLKKPQQRILIVNLKFTLYHFTLLIILS